MLQNTLLQRAKAETILPGDRIVFFILETVNKRIAAPASQSFKKLAGFFSAFENV